MPKAKAKAKAMRILVKALRKEGIPVRKSSDVKMGDSPERCRLCKHETARPLVYWSRAHTLPCWIDVCADRPACRRRQAEAEAARIRRVLDEVVI